MKTFFLCFIVFTVLTGCKKITEKAEYDAITMAVTNGQWKVSRFVKGGNDVTIEFSEYKFQFLSNRTVDAIKNGSVNASGTWAANVENRSIASKFLNAQNPLLLLNGVWTITRNSWTFVEANQTINNEIYTLRLDKV